MCTSRSEVFLLFLSYHQHRALAFLLHILIILYIFFKLWLHGKKTSRWAWARIGIGFAYFNDITLNISYGEMRDDWDGEMTTDNDECGPVHRSNLHGPCWHVGGGFWGVMSWKAVLGRDRRLSTALNKLRWGLYFWCHYYSVGWYINWAPYYSVRLIVWRRKPCLRYAICHIDDFLLK